ncbi:MAG: protein DA1 [Melioribacteraceae bacterium]|nr:protein DA1 [Melioribacteraceae bacterium]
MRTRYLTIILAAFLLSNYLSAQSRAICYTCNEPISGQYLVLDGKKFHPDHFLCDKCKLPISGSYQKESNKYYHLDCFSEMKGLYCAFCGEVFTGGYIEVNGKKYHKLCFENNVAERCWICNNPLSGGFLSDIYGNKFHSIHENELERCNNCNRLISENSTEGGVQYNDGRSICNICYNNAVNGQKAVEAALSMVISDLEQKGIKINSDNISIRASDRKILQSAAGLSYSSKMQGFCDTQTKVETLNGKEVSRNVKHTIYALTGVPERYIQTTIAHELMHVWLHENTTDKQNEILREGSCNFASYLFLKDKSDNLSKEILLGLENDPDPAYGNGFRLVKNRFKDRPIVDLLNFLIKERTL